MRPPLCIIARHGPDCVDEPVILEVDEKFIVI
jgi:hypothetical protein